MYSNVRVMYLERFWAKITWNNIQETKTTFNDSNALFSFEYDKTDICTISDEKNDNIICHARSTSESAEENSDITYILTIQICSIFLIVIPMYFATFFCPAEKIDHRAFHYGGIYPSYPSMHNLINIAGRSDTPMTNRTRRTETILTRRSTQPTPFMTMPLYPGIIPGERISEIKQKKRDIIN
eukprot:UN34683